jgi:hypothetical protein
MLKLQDDYTTLTATFEDFLLLVYTIINDLYQPFIPSNSTLCNSFPIAPATPTKKIH